MSGPVSGQVSEAAFGEIDRQRRRRALVTPEGVDLRLELASVAQRLGAFLIDAGALVLAMVALTAACLAGLAATGRGGGPAAGETAAILWLLGFFALRNGYWLLFDLSPRGATPGKRLLGVRVAARNGARLTADAVFARNAMREVELFLPLGFVVAAGAQGAQLLALTGLGWSAGVLLLPFFTRDHLRAGDLIAGTWVVCEPRRRLLHDMAGQGETLASRYLFTAAQLDAYGERELQVLEEVLRRNHRATVKDVAARIRRKIGWTARPEERDLDFLDAFYAAERRKLEQDLLFGRRRLHKDDHSGRQG